MNHDPPTKSINITLSMKIIFAHDSFPFVIYSTSTRHSKVRRLETMERKAVHYIHYQNRHRSDHAALSTPPPSILFHEM